MKKKKLTMVQMIDNLLTRVTVAMSQIELIEKNISEPKNEVDIKRREGEVIVCLEILDQIYDSGFALTKSQVNIIVNAKKKMFTTLYAEREPVAGSSN